jgi:hypothetical protein
MSKVWRQASNPAHFSAFRSGIQRNASDERCSEELS